MPGSHCRNRQFEWTMSLVLLGIGVWLSVWPRAMMDSSFRLIYELVGPDLLRFCYLSVGAFRVLALFANGHWKPWGPYVRAVGSVIGCAIWLQMAAALWMLSVSGGIEPSVGILVYGILAIAELKATRRARADANRLL